MLTQQEMKRFNEQIAEVEAHFHSKRKIHVEYIDVISALMEELKEANPETICRMGLSTEALISALANHAFAAAAILGHIEDSSIDVPGSLRRVYSALGNAEAGEWEILANDKGDTGRMLKEAGLRG